MPFKWHPSFGVCSKCGCYVNKRPMLQEELEEFYSMHLYWETRQRQLGVPTIENRSALYRSDGRVDRWLALIDKYGPGKGRVIEVGCAPGVLLQELHKRGYECIGVEVDAAVAGWIRQTYGMDIRAGLFPGIDLPSCDIFLAFDVFEHAVCPKDFMCEISKRLRPNGVAIIQTVIDRYTYEPPFGERFDMFDDLEHLFLFTDSAMQLLARCAGLEIVSREERIWLGGEVCVLKKP